MKRLCISLAILLALPLTCAAQFYTPGANPFKTRWSSVQTDTYRIIYPEGLDSLAKSYAVALEKYRGLEAAGCGFAPNEKYNKRFPIVLHPFGAYSNGMVSWAPRAMHLYTVPEAFDPESTPWVDQLAVHESRHVAQMQLGKATPGFRFMNILTGELWPGLISGLYPGPALLEGDAVVAETALGKGGRGRTADFLEYYRVSFADSLYRDWYQWRWGSQKRYTPNHYGAGYLLNAGIRAFYGDNFFAHYTGRIKKKGLRVGNLQHTVREASGKSLNSAFKEIQKNLTGIWAQDDARRAPFTDGEAVTSPGRLYDTYTSLVFDGDKLYALHSGISRNKELVQVDEKGRARHLAWFSTSSSRLAWSSHLEELVWTENKPDLRWENNSSTVVKARNREGKVRTIAGGAIYFNPAPDPSSKDIAVVQYYSDGTASVAVLDGKSGNKILDYPAPEGVQPVEPVWMKEGLFVSGISSAGYTIYRISSVDGAFSGRLGWAPLFPAAHAKVNRLFGHDGLIWFTSDMDGVNNLYSVDPDGKTILQRSSTRFGGNEFAFSPEGDLYYSAPRVKTREIRKIAADSLLTAPVMFKAPFHHVAEVLSAMEPAQPDPKFRTRVSEPSPYDKSSLPRIHSWYPSYVDYDIVNTLTYEQTTYAGGLGATVMFQNDLGTTWGSLGVSLSACDTLATETPDWDIRPSAHAQLVFSGLPIALEFRLDANERDAHHYRIPTRVTGGKIVLDSPYVSVISSTPYVKASMRAYLPLDFSSGGWNRGAVLSAKLLASNDLTDIGPLERTTSYISFLQTGATLYSTLPIRPSCLYPRYGAGGGIGYITPGSPAKGYPFSDFSERLEAKAYGYLPGIMDTHGLRLAANYTHTLGSEWVNSNSLELSANYAFPFAPVDCSILGPIAYIRNFEAILHADYRQEAFIVKSSGERSVWDRTRVGATVQARLANWLWAPADMRIGVRGMYNITRPGESFTELVVSTDLF